MGRFRRERRSLPSVALTTDTSILTAIGNDYGFDKVFQRQVEALGVPGDVLVGISTSGNSQNVCAALDAARNLGAFTVALTGEGGGAMADIERISAQQTHAKAESNQALLVCAYDDEAKCRMVNLEGSISFASFKSRVNSLPKSQEIIFY